MAKTLPSPSLILQLHRKHIQLKALDKELMNALINGQHQHAELAA